MASSKAESKSADAALHQTVSQKDERKKQRAQRIEQRFANEAKEKGLARGGDGRGFTETRTQSQQQVADSLAHLDKKKQMGIEEVTAIRTEADFRENRRRIKDDAQAQERLQMLQEEAISSGKQNAAIEMRWAELLELNMPQQLYSEIEAQKKACLDIITSKDSLIREFKKQLKLKDEEAVKSLKRYGEDVEELLKRMRREIRELQQHYEVEMDAIETAFLMERDESVKKQQGEMEGLLERRRQKELAYMKAKQLREETYQKEIQDLLVQEAEEYNKLKIKLETEIQINEQQLEEMRATYQLNTEKLEYNYRVLTERDMENTATLAHQKRKLSKLKDSLGTLMLKFRDHDARDRRRNDELTDEYRRITKQYKDLQAKFRHFETADNERFEKVWCMHEEEVRKAVDRVLTADDIMHQQLFGWDWRPPKLDLIYSPEEPAPTNATLHNNNQNEEDDENGDEGQREGAVIDTAKVRHMLELLSAEAGFLVDPKVREALSSLPPEEASLAQAESLLRALSVTDEGALQTLLTYFMRDVVVEEPSTEEAELDGTGPGPTGGSTTGEMEGKETTKLGSEGTTPLPATLDDMPEEVKRLQAVIQPDDVILAVQRFVDDRKEGDAAGSNGRSASEERAIRAKHMRNRVGRKNRNTSLALHEREFWTRMANVLPEQHRQAWLRLETELQNYNKLLTDRARCLEGIGKLQQENANLKQMLNVYLSDSVNDHLIVPPTETFRLEPGVPQT